MRIYILAGYIALIITQAAHAQAPQIISHRVLYDINLYNISPAAQIETIQGQAHYRLQRNCDGWQVTEDYAIAFGFDTNVSTFIAHYETWESFEGNAFTFSGSEDSTLQGESNYDGFANITDDGAEAFYSTQHTQNNNKNHSRKLPENTAFPTHYMHNLIDQARLNVKANRGHLFIGGDYEEGSLYFVSAIMGNRKPLATDKDANKTDDKDADNALGTLAENGYWPISIAYYDPEAKTPEPEYEVEFQIQDNGVVRSYVVRYSDFSMKATARSAEKIAEPQCS